MTWRQLTATWPYSGIATLTDTLKAAKEKKFVDYGPEFPFLQVSQLEWAVGEDIIK